jgi:hypothetical protein
MYKLYRYKNLNCGFVVLCPSCNIQNLNNTANSIKTVYPDSNILFVMPNHCSKEVSDSSSKFGKTYKSDPNIAAMINKGLNNATADWNFVIFAKGWLRSRIDIKYSYFVSSERDILFPIVGKRLNFLDADINIFLIHKKAFETVGNFPEINAFDNSKLIWTGRVLDKGCILKGVVGGQAF